LKPRFELQTLLLWLATPMVFVGGGFALWLNAKRRSKAAPDATASLTAEEEARLAALMAAEAPAEKS
jgi:cytochrome c-type biogenesis protein CcmH